MKVLMVGATGKFAGLVLPELTQRGATVRALVRDQAKSDVARDRGATETIIGDQRDVESLRRAADGIEAVFHIGPGMAPDEADLGVALGGMRSSNLAASLSHIRSTQRPATWIIVTLPKWRRWL